LKDVDEGEAEIARFMVPVKTPRGATVTVEVPVLPAHMLTLVELLVTE